MVYHLAQLNCATSLTETDHPDMAEFMENLDRINKLAEGSPGFVWRFTGEGNDAADVRILEDPLFLLNMSVWADVESLHAYVYRSAHAPFIGRGTEWFQAHKEPHMVLWWIKAGHRPTPQEALEKLDRLKLKGPTPEAFSFKKRFAPPAIV